MKSIRKEIITFSVNGHTLSGILSRVGSNSKNVVILLHPHPLYGGNMDNPIILSLERSALDFGFATFRFNFRGTSGTYEVFQGMGGATLDSKMAYKALDEHELSLYGIVGYSFGGSVALRLALSTHPEFVITLSASLDLFCEKNFSLSELQDINCPVLMFHGTSDKMIPYSDIEKLTSEIGNNATVVPLTNENHFYNRSMPLVSSQVEKFLTDLRTTPQL